MEIRTTGVLGSLNTFIDVQILSPLNNQYHYINGKGYLKIGDKITACIYKSGKIQIYGIKEIDKIQHYWDLILEIIQSYVDISKADAIPKLKFMVVSEKLPYKINLQIISHLLTSENIEYEPEQFPAIIWKLTYSTCLLFSTGSCIFSGANSIEKINYSITEIKSKIELVGGFI